jgi:hypothetical protein
MKISCPHCGNDADFYEVAEGVTITTFYRQNDDGSFSALRDDSEIEGEVRLFLRGMPQRASGISRTLHRHALLMTSGNPVYRPAGVPRPPASLTGNRGGSGKKPFCHFAQDHH